MFQLAVQCGWTRVPQCPPEEDEEKCHLVEAGRESSPTPSSPHCTLLHRLAHHEGPAMWAWMRLFVVLLALAAAAGYLAVRGLTSSGSSSSTRQPPQQQQCLCGLDLLAGPRVAKHFDLVVRSTLLSLPGGKQVAGMTYNGTYIGPEIRVQLGDEVSIDVYNMADVGGCPIFLTCIVVHLPIAAGA